MPDETEGVEPTASEPEEILAATTSPSVADSGSADVEPDGLLFGHLFESWEQPPTVPSARRRTQRRVLTGTAALAVVLVASLLVIGAGGPGSKNADALVALGAQTTLAQHTVQMSVSGSFSTNGTSIPLTGSGVADLSAHLEDITMSFAAAGTSVQETVLVSGGSSYMQMIENGQNGIAQLLPGKHWVSMTTAVPGSTGIGSSTSNILQQLQVLAQRGNSVTSLGSSTINGEAVSGYQVTITSKAMAAASKRVIAQGGAEAQAMRTFLRNFAMSPPTVKIWLGADHLLRRETVQVNMTTTGTSVSGTVQIDFTNYGSPVTVNIPAASDVGSYSDFLSAATNAANNAR